MCAHCGGLCEMHGLKDVGGCVNKEAGVTGAQAAWRSPNNSLWGGLTVLGAWAFIQHEEPSWGP